MAWSADAYWASRAAARQNLHDVISQARDTVADASQKVLAQNHNVRAAHEARLHVDAAWRALGYALEVLGQPDKP